ncbi:cation transporter [Pontibacillus halophilus JSM 076056 = DSM 19796]|uniref:Cation transporter n=1 Tax=Pontibacillus halophilus JSM 076056 = DSM 19796 TaxID=1385510 RepID=A0A0A5IAJ3_9BACI|nr:sodium:calcium antiporter [Pontibacillus halophilus]KGX92857.1 cation transporter [Pontibacillus halophilus JSM 076056 = DSM 19796]
MVYLLFAIAATVTVILAVYLSIYADVIDKKTAISGAMIGLLLGASTSLPEITTSVTSIVIDNPDLAVGNLLGSNLFNVCILAVLDLIYRRQRILNHSNQEHLSSSILGIVMSLVVMLSLLFNGTFAIFAIGLDTLLLITLYIIGVKVMSYYSNEGEKEAGEPLEERYDVLSLRQVVLRFITVSLLTIVFGSILTISGDEIAVLTGLGSSFVGSLLIAASTSLPEAVASIMAIRLKNYPLMIGGIVGSNLFNLLILSGTDIFYRKDALLQAASGAHIYSILGSMSLIAILIYSLLRKRARNAFTYVIPSILIILCYLAASYMIYTSSTSL